MLKLTTPFIKATMFSLGAGLDLCIGGQFVYSVAHLKLRTKLKPCEN